MTTMRSANLTLRKGTVTTSTKTAATKTTLTGVGAARNESRTRSSRSRAVLVAGRGPSLGRMLLPRAHPCIAHYRPLTGAHNGIPPAKPTFRGPEDQCRAGRDWPATAVQNAPTDLAGTGSRR